MKTRYSVSSKVQITTDLDEAMRQVIVVSLLAKGEKSAKISSS